MTDEIWACSACRSINKAKAKRCYKCRTPRDVSGVDPASISLGASQPGPALARPRFRSTRGLALLASILVLGVGALRVLALVTIGPLIESLLSGAEPTQADLTRVANLGLLSVLIPLMALIVWAYWLSRVVTVMPALDLGYPHSTGLTSFVECLIPIFNFFRVPAILRDVTRRVAPADGRGDALIAAAWIGLIGGFLLERIGGVVIGLKATSDAQLIRDSLALAGITAGLTIVGIAFLVYLTWWIEARIGRRHAELALAERPAPVVAPPVAEPEPAPDPALIPEPFLPMAAAAAASAAPPLVASSTPVAAAAIPPLPEDGPHLQIRISGETIEASLDGTDWEDVSLTELREAAVAIRDASGTTTLRADENVVASGLGRDVLGAIRDSGATYTVLPA